MRATLNGMQSTFRLGRFAGIDIGVNWSWLVIFGLIVWTLSQSVFPNQNPGHSDNTYLLMGAIAAIAFFASLLGHELGHAIQARREGMQIEGITLWLFGGVAKFRGLFPSAGAEFRIAIAGPLVSLVLGGLFLLIARASLPSTVDGVIWWLGFINLLLLAFNLLPALPLDGGRILRSALWHFKGNFAPATRLAAGIGRGFGYLLIAGGIALAFVEGIFSGVWLAFIGLFLLQAAHAEASQARTRGVLTDRRVGALMTPNPVSVDVDTTIGAFMEHVAWPRLHATYPVVDGSRVVGLLVRRCAQEIPRSEWDTRSVSVCTIPLERVPQFSEEDPAERVLATLTATRTGRGVVLDGERLVGVISLSDLARAVEPRQA